MKKSKSNKNQKIKQHETQEIRHSGDQTKPTYDYDIIEATSISKILHIVDTLKRKGWEPLGAATPIVEPQGVSYIQTMIRYHNGYKPNVSTSVRPKAINNEITISVDEFKGKI